MICNDVRVFRRVMFFLPWLVLFFIEIPHLIPEALGEQKLGSILNVLLRWGVITVAAYYAYKGRAEVPKPKRTLAFSLLTVVGWVAVGAGATIFPRAFFSNCSPGPLGEVQVCHRWVMGFSNDIPYYSLAKGPVSEWFCDKLSLKVHNEERTLAPVECPSQVEGNCYATEWRTPNGSNYWVAVATDRHCDRGIYFDGRGQPARDRWSRIRGIY